MTTTYSNDYWVGAFLACRASTNYLPKPYSWRRPQAPGAPKPMNLAAWAAAVYLGPPWGPRGPAMGAQGHPHHLVSRFRRTRPDGHFRTTRPDDRFGMVSEQGIRLIAKFTATLFFAEMGIKSWQLADSASRQGHDLLCFSRGQLGRAMT